MSSIVLDSHASRASRFYQATIGKKAVMAVTGMILFGFIVAHLVGNLQAFEGPAKFDAYSAFLHATPGLLWSARVVLLVSVALHIVAAVQLAALQKTARPVGYVKSNFSHSSYASRTMIWSGVIIAAFVVYHLLDLTFGAVNPGYVEGSVYRNLVGSFQRVPVAIAYVVAILLLSTHLYHGLYSMFQSLGATHPRYTPKIKRFAAVASVLIAAGYISIPVGVLTGVVHL